MDLFIHTLTGTVFELRVSPFETILSIKAKIQRLEGIPISQQHLVWRLMELEDEYCLHDYSIKNGATLRLVLAMRDGPINMRRVSVEEPSLQEMAEYMDANRDEVWEKLMNDNRQVTLLVFREGDQLNFFRVYDRGDGTVSPYSDSLSGGSIYNVYEEEEVIQVTKEKQEENLITRDKMDHLRKKIAASSSKKVKHVPRPPSKGRSVTTLDGGSTNLDGICGTDLAKRRIHFSKQPSRSMVSRHSIIPKTESTLNQYDTVEMTPSPQKLDYFEKSEPDVKRRPLLPPVLAKGKLSSDVDVADIISNHSDDLKTTSSFHARTTNHSFNTNDHDSKCSPKLQRNKRLPSLCDAKEIKKSRENNDLHKSSRSRRRVLKPLGAVDKYNASGMLSELKSPPQDKNHVLRQTYVSEMHNESNPPSNSRDLNDVLKDSQLTEILRDPVELENYKKLLNWVRPKTDDQESLLSKNTTGRPGSRRRRKTPDGRLSVKLNSTKIHPHGNHLPPVLNEKRHPPTLSGKKKTRCTLCAKKLGLVTTYQCRCGFKFCPSHRYPETHTCSYDYKTEGRKTVGEK